MDGNLVRAARERRGWTREDLLYQLRLQGHKLSLSSIVRIEQESPDARYSTVLALAKVLDTTVEALSSE